MWLANYQCDLLYCPTKMPPVICEVHDIVAAQTTLELQLALLFTPEISIQFLHHNPGRRCFLG